MTRAIILTALALATAPAVHAQIAPGELVAPHLEISGGNLNFTVQPSVSGRNYEFQAPQAQETSPVKEPINATKEIERTPFSVDTPGKDASDTPRAQEPARVWTDTRGRTTTAAFVAADNESMQMKKDDGNVYSVALSRRSTARRSTADREYIKERTSKQAKSRNATLTDTSGVKTKLSGLTFEPTTRITRHHAGRYQSKYRDPFSLVARHGLAVGDWVAVSTKSYDIAIPIDNIVSVDTKGTALTVAFYWQGQQKQVTGALEDGLFRGKPVFGDFGIFSDKVKSLIFTSPSRSTPEGIQKDLSEANTGFKATIFLNNGTEIPLDGLTRFNHFGVYSTKNYLIGGGTTYYNNHSTDFQCLWKVRSRNNETRFSFRGLKSIEFAATGVTVTDTKGNSVPRELYFENEAKCPGAICSGFTGLSDTGLVFIETRAIKRIVFEVGSEGRPL